MAFAALTDPESQEHELDDDDGPSQGNLAVIVNKQPPWDPLSSSDWDREKHSPAALIRIQR